MPEVAVRECIVRDIKLPSTNFDPLRAIGGEFAEAVGIAPEPKLPGQPRPPRKETTNRSISSCAHVTDRPYGSIPGSP